MNETALIERTGFASRKLEDVHPNQIAEMARKCRRSCQELYQNTTFHDLPEMVRAIGGYGDVITDNVGYEKRVCSLGDVSNNSEI